MERERLEKELRGFYRTGCFHIYLNGGFDPDLDKMCQRDQGSFLHEYVHYMQNISTPFGIFEAVALNEATVETFIDIQPKTEIELPYNPPLSEELRQRLSWLNWMNGNSVKEDDSFIFVDETKEISYGWFENSIVGRTGRLVVLEFSDKLGNGHRRIIGALDIKEAMAASFQSLIDPDAKHPDIPYNLLRMFCKKHFPSVGNDIKKFICICYISLFSLEPAYHFVDICHYAEKNKDKTGFQLFEDYMQDHPVIVGGKSMTPWQHFNELLIQYSQSIGGLIREETPYFNQVFERVRMVDGNVPILNVINTDEPFTIENVKTLIQTLGIPYMHAQGKGWFFPALDGEGASDVVHLVGANILYRFLVGKELVGMCPLVAMCEQKGDYCYDQPWLERDCPFELIGNEIRLKDKKIIIKI